MPALVCADEARIGKTEPDATAALRPAFQVLQREVVVRLGDGFDEAFMPSSGYAFRLLGQRQGRHAGERGLVPVHDLDGDATAAPAFGDFVHGLLKGGALAVELVDDNKAG